MTAPAVAGLFPKGAFVMSLESLNLRPTRALGLFVMCGAMLFSSFASAQDDSESIEELRQRLKQVELELQKLKISGGLSVPDDPKSQKLLMLVENPFIGSLGYSSNGQNRFLVGKLIVVNLTNKPVKIKREQIKLDSNGEVSELKDIPSTYRSRSFRLRNQTAYLNNMRPAAELTARPGGTGSMWFFFTAIPKNNEIPSLKLQVETESSKQTVDINQAAADVLSMSIERVGPRELLGVLTVNGELNPINLGAVMEALDSFAKQKVVRVVLNFGDSATQLDSSMQSWLTQVANSGPGNTAENQIFPPVPSGIRELHISSLPSSSSSSRSSSSSSVNRVHPNLEAAVMSALAGVYERLPVPELLDAIEQGSKVSRAVAIASSGGRLPSSELPRLLKYADDEEPEIQKAALRSLAHFGEKEAIDKLVAYARKNAPPTAEVATESLAASRFNPAHAALLEILQNEPPDSKKSIVKILAKHPRPIWSETIYEFAADPDSGITVEAMTALMKIGHPKLYEVLGKSLEHESDRKLRDTAFNLLVQSNSAKADKMATEYTLNYIKDKAPNSQMTQLLKKTKEQRAIPFLVEHLKKGGSSRSAVIDCLVQIGDEKVIDLFVERYSTFETHEQSSVLNALQQMRSPQFRELARQALLSNNSSLISTAARGLQTDASDEAVEMLAQALDSSSNSSTLSYVSNALGQLGTDRARQALMKARRSGNATKSRYATNALRSIQQRSPGYQYVYNARKMENEKKYKEAAELYDAAIKADKNLPDAYAGRGHALMKEKKFEKAVEDFDRAIKLDDYNALAITGKALIQIMEGKIDEGIATVEEAKDRLAKDSLFAYNTACVYSQSLAFVNKNEDLADRDKKMKLYESEAINYLEQAMKLGFSQKELLKDDPDLDPLRENDRFKAIAGPPKPKKEAAKAGTEQVKPPVPARSRPKL